MPWVRTDDGYPEHRKVAPLSDAAFRLHSQGMHWCARHLTDGVVRRDELATVTRMRRPGRVAAELVARGLWHEAGQACDHSSCPASVLVIADGWIFHDYWDYQPSKARVEAERKAKAARQRRWSEKRRRVDGVSADASMGASGDGAPYPPRPEGGGGGGLGGRRLCGFEDDGHGRCTGCGLPEHNQRHRGLDS